MTMLGKRVEEGDKVMYQGQRATVLEVKRLKLKIRDVYGYPRDVKRSECDPNRE